MGDMPAVIFALDRGQRRDVGGKDRAEPPHSGKVTRQAVGQEQRERGHQSAKLEIGLVDEIPPGSLVNRLQRPLVDVAAPLGREDRHAIIDLHQLLAEPDLLLHMLPLGRLRLERGHEACRLAISKRGCAGKFPSRLCLRNISRRDDPRDRLEDRARQAQLGIKDVADHLLGVPGCPAFGEITHRHGPYVELMRGELRHLRRAIDHHAGGPQGRCLKDQPILLHAGNEIAPNTLFVDRIEGAVVGRIVASTGRGAYDVVDKPDQIGRPKHAGLDVDRIEGRDDPLAHRDQLRCIYARTAADADREQNPKIAQVERPIARQRQPGPLAQ